MLVQEGTNLISFLIKRKLAVFSDEKSFNEIGCSNMDNKRREFCEMAAIEGDTLRFFHFLS